MKKQLNNNSNRMQNAAIAISATLPETQLLIDLVEKLADWRYDDGCHLEKVQQGWQTIKTSSIEAYANIDISLSCETEIINIPLVTSFLFTCTKGKEQDYNFRWLCSLS